MSSDRPPASRPPKGGLAGTTPRSEIDAFLQRARTLAPLVAPGTRGRLLFALDATLSRQPTWDIACALQADMFREAAAIGGLDVQLIYYRSLTECRASPWVADAGRLAKLMSNIDCRGGHTQIRKVLAHARRETAQQKIQALVFIGDAMEEAVDDLCASAGELGLLGVPALMFQEGEDAIAERAFREIARLTRGAYCRFDAGAAETLRELLRAAAVYAAGGLRALNSDASRSHGARLLLQQLG
ncbi:VWA domain-containing protein [bacterium]|nr:VWA domain-containing protein [bacterium]